MLHNGVHALLFQRRHLLLCSVVDRVPTGDDNRDDVADDTGEPAQVFVDRDSAAVFWHGQQLFQER